MSNKHDNLSSMLIKKKEKIKMTLQKKEGKILSELLKVAVCRHKAGIKSFQKNIFFFFYFYNLLYLSKIQNK